ncbi:MAG TPA: MFS transporter [Stellaceae bacterium]|nr:MFS transporter [Stellaceae bacterium]
MAETVNVTKLIDGRRIGGYQYLVAALCALTVFLDGYDTQSIAFVAPSIAQELHLTRPELGPLFVASLVGLLIGQLFFGPLADKVGRRAVIIVCTIVFGAFTIGAATTTSFGGLLAYRFIAGLGLGGAMPNGIALTAEYSPTRRRATVVMIMFTGFSLGAAFGGAVAASLIPGYGWRSVWYVGGILPLLLVPVQYFALPESIRFLIVTEADNARVAALLRRLAADFIPPRGATYDVDEAHAHGIPVAHLFRNKRAFGTFMLWIMFFTNLLSIFFLQNWIPTMAHDSGLTIRTAVIVGTMFQVGGVLGSILIGWPIDKYGPYGIITLLFAGAVVFVALIGWTAGAAPALMALTFGAGFCIIGGQNSANALAAIFYPTAMRATGVGWALGIGRIGGILGPLIASALLAAHMSYGLLFLLGAISPLVSTIAVFGMGRIYRA